jgi:hypothetical protein
VHLAATLAASGVQLLLFRASGDADAAPVRHELLAMEPRLMFVNQGTMGARSRPHSSGQDRRVARGGFAPGDIARGDWSRSYRVFHRPAPEIGIRSLGADRRDVLRLILRQGALLVIAGGLTGAVLAALAAAVSSVLYGVTAVRSNRLGVAALILVITAALARGAILRAVAIDPARTLRSD